MPEEPLPPSETLPTPPDPAPPAVPVVMTTAPGTPGPLPHEPNLEPGKQQDGIELVTNNEAPREMAAVPKNVAPPTITGVAKVGEELTAVPGTWVNEPEGPNGLWFYVDEQGKPTEVAAFGAGAPYIVKPEDVGRRVAFGETTENRFGQSGVELSAPSEVIAE